MADVKLTPEITDILFYILCGFSLVAIGFAFYLAYILCSILIAFTRMCDKEKDNNDIEGG